MPSQPTDPASRRPRRQAPDDPFSPLRSQRARYLSRTLLIAVSCLAILGVLIGMPVVRALAPAILNTVAPVMVRAVVRAPAAPAAPPQKTTACTHMHMQAGSHPRHVCG
ncbi:MAG TPA: hypothetical protein VFE06_11790 [Acidobacteriaceae bacterium]|jgi:hypothetical protein|nr:hypothetical protein [Acidobacteriaceae bacterium]